MNFLKFFELKTDSDNKGSSSSLENLYIVNDLENQSEKTELFTADSRDEYEFDLDLFLNGMDVAMGTWGSISLAVDGWVLCGGRDTIKSALVSVGLIIAGIVVGFLSLLASDFSIDFMLGLFIMTFASAIIFWLTRSVKGPKDWYWIYQSKIWFIIFSVVSAIGILMGFLNLILNIDDLASTVFTYIGFSAAAFIYIMAIMGSVYIYRLCEHNWKIPHLILTAGAIILSIITFLLIIWQLKEKNII